MLIWRYVDDVITVAKVLRAVKVITLRFDCPAGGVVYGDSFIDAGVAYTSPSGTDQHREAAVLTSIVPEVTKLTNPVLFK